MTTSPTRIVDYLLVGGGLAAASAAEELRKRDQQGSIVIVTVEPWLPYNRPPLSKEYLRSEIGADGTYGSGGIYVQNADWYKEQRIEVQTSTEALILDPKRRMVTFTGNRALGYRTLLLATGGRPRSLNVPGNKLQGVYLLRTLTDANILRDQITSGKRIVVIGSGFIGMEVAASALSKGAQVTIIEPQEHIWPSIISPELSAYFKRQFEKHGAQIYYGYRATEFIAGPDGKLASVRISPVQDSGPSKDIVGELAVVGIGIQLNTELAATANLEIDSRHGIVVDEHLETSIADIFVAGDVAAYPDPYTGRMHFEHWDNAIASGQIAAANMAGGEEPYRHIPYFFSDQFDLSINMLGYPTSSAQIATRGDMAANKFTALYVQNGSLQAALMVNDDEQMDLIRELIAARAPVSNPQSLSDPSFDLSSLQPKNE